MEVAYLQIHLDLVINCHSSGNIKVHVKRLVTLEIHFLVTNFSLDIDSIDSDSEFSNEITEAELTLELSRRNSVA